VTARRNDAASAGEDTEALEAQLRDLAQEQVGVLRDRLDVAVLRRTEPE
jgi:hypothetical protein